MRRYVFTTLYVTSVLLYRTVVVNVSDEIYFIFPYLSNVVCRHAAELAPRYFFFDWPSVPAVNSSSQQRHLLTDTLNCNNKTRYCMLDILFACYFIIISVM